MGGGVLPRYGVLERESTCMSSRMDTKIMQINERKFMWTPILRNNVTALLIREKSP